MLTKLEIESHYAITIGTVPSVTFYPAVLRKWCSRGIITVDFHVGIPRVDACNFKAAVRNYIKPYLDKGESVSCFLSGRWQRIKIRCACSPTSPFVAEINNKVLEQLLERLNP